MKTTIQGYRDLDVYYDARISALFTGPDIPLPIFIYQINDPKC